MHLFNIQNSSVSGEIFVVNYVIFGMMLNAKHKKEKIRQD